MTHGVPQDTQAPAASDAPAGPVFRAPYAPPDEQVAAELLGEVRRPGAAEGRIDAAATRLIEGIRARAGGLGGIEDFLHAYSLSTKEGLALMVLAEALLRVPDAATADRLIEDKLAAGDWSAQEVRSNALLVSASAWTLGITARIIQPGETPDAISTAWSSVSACRRCAPRRARRCGFWVPTSCWGRPSRRRCSAPRATRIGAIPSTCWARARAPRPTPSATSPPMRAPSRPSARARARARCRTGRASRSSCRRCIRASRRSRATACCAELVPRLLELARRARDLDLNFTVDAEEADRLELSLEVIAAVLADPSLRGWEGFGLAVQAYQKRAPAVIDWLAETARALGRRLMVRLVKGAYWDTEVKRAQERGLAGLSGVHPQGDDRSLLCGLRAQAAGARPRLYPQFATHNALTVASVIEDAGGVEGYEFQRLHGMGEVLYEPLRAEHAERGRAASMRRSAGTATCWPIWCGGCWRTAPIRRSCRWRPIRRADRRNPPAAAELDRRCGTRAPSENSAAARSLWPVAAEFGRRRIRRPREPRCAARRRSRRRGPDRRRAPLIDGDRELGRRTRRWSRRSTATAIGSVREGDDAIAAAAMAAARRALPAGARRRSRAAPWRSNAPAICSKRGAAA